MSQEWTLPLQIRVSIGAPQLVTGQAAASPARFNRRATPPTPVGAEESTDAYMDKFSVTSLADTTFNYRTALSLALASRLAYGAKSEVESTGKNVWKLDTCEFVEEDETQCFVASCSQAALVSFRGTENLGDWLANMNVLGTTQSYGRVHRGFLGAFQVVDRKLQSILDKFPKILPVLITGHSLGGALAVVAAAEWHQRYNISWIHTHGQPGVGKKNFQAFMETIYGDSYFRFVNDDDIVPMVPPFYTHAGRLIHFGEEEGVESVLGSGELEAVGIGLGGVPVETPMMSEQEFDLMRARLLQERVARAGAPLDEESVQSAALEATGLEGVEGLIPSVSDHDMNTYVRKIAHEAGF